MALCGAPGPQGLEDEWAAADECACRGRKSPKCMALSLIAGALRHDFEGIGGDPTAVVQPPGAAEAGYPSAQGAVALKACPQMALGLGRGQSAGEVSFIFLYDVRTLIAPQELMRDLCDIAFRGLAPP